MERFSKLLFELQDAKDGSEKIQIVADYFRARDDIDAAWTLKVLLDPPTKRLVSVRLLRLAGSQAVDLPDWLFDQSIDAVGDIAEAVSLMLPESDTRPDQVPKLAAWIQDRLLPLAGKEPNDQVESLIESWSMLSADARFIFNKFATGLLKPEVSRQEVVEALSRCWGIPSWAIQFRLANPWLPSQDSYGAVHSLDLSDVEVHRPYRHCRASSTVSQIGPEGWHVEWKWTGIRVQAMRRAKKTTLWQNGQEVVSDRWPEIRDELSLLPDGTVLDGMIVELSGEGLDSTTPNGAGIRRKVAGSTAGVFIAFDILEFQSEDIRQRALHDRRACFDRLRDYLSLSLISEIVTPGLTRVTESIYVTEPLDFTDWGRTLDEAKRLGADGLVLKPLDSSYATCEAEDSWLVIKTESKTLFGVLMNVERAAAGHLEQLTVGVWRGEELVPIAKVLPAFSEEELATIEAFIKECTLERFGPVRTVKAQVVIQIAYDGIEPSPRRKAGIMLRSPRMIAMQGDMTPSSATRLDTLTET